MTSKPKPKRESRTIRFNNLVSAIVGAAAVLPSLVSYGLNLLGDPTIAATIADAVPVKYRAALAILVLIVTQRNKALRMSTSAPIAERWLATDDAATVAQPPDVPAPRGHSRRRRAPRTS